MADGPSHVPIDLAFAGLGGVASETVAAVVLPTEMGEALRAFFVAHPLVDGIGFELALDEAGDDLEFAGGLLYAVDGTPLREGRDAQRAGEAFRRLLRDPHVSALPIRLAVAMEGIDHVFRIAREATGAPPAEGARRAGEDRESARARARLEAHDARWDQRDVLRDDDGAA